MQALPLAVLPTLLLACGAERIPDTAHGTVEFAANRLADHDPGALWGLLPPSYQEDVTLWTRQVADRLPGKLYEKTFIALERLGVLLKSRSDYLRSVATPVTQMFGSSSEEDVEAVMVALGDINILLAKSDLATVETLQHADLGEFLHGTGSKILSLAARALRITGSDPIANLRDLPCEVLTQGPQPTLRITVEGTEFEVEFIQIEKRWVPVELVDAWPQIEEQVDNFLETTSARLVAWALERPLDQLIEDLDQLLAADSREEFERVFRTAISKYSNEFDTLRKLLTDG